MKCLLSLPPSQPAPFHFNYFFVHSPLLKDKDKNKISLGTSCGTNSSHLLLLCHLLCLCALALPMHVCCLFRLQALGDCLTVLLVPYHSLTLLLVGFKLLSSETQQNVRSSTPREVSQELLLLLNFLHLCCKQGCSFQRPHFSTAL